MEEGKVNQIGDVLTEKRSSSISKTCNNTKNKKIAWRRHGSGENEWERIKRTGQKEKSKQHKKKPAQKDGHIHSQV